MGRAWRSGLGRWALALLGVGVLLGAALYSSVPRPSARRVEASLRTVGVYAGGAFAWVLRTQSGAVLIDAGMEPDGSAILDELERQGLSRRDVHAVLLTHAHADHWAAAALFPSAQVWVGPGDAALVRGEQKPRGALSGFFAGLLPQGPIPSGMQELADDQVLELDGERIRAIHVPGHTPGSMMYLWGELLFTGDSLMRDGNGVAAASWLFSDDGAQNRRSLQKLLALPFTRIADGHAGVTEDARQKLGRYLEVSR